MESAEKKAVADAVRFQNKNSIFYGVWITAAVWAIYFLSATPAAYGSSIVSTQVVLQKGWDEGIIGMGTSIFYLSMAIISIPTSILIRKKGIRPTIIVGAAVGIATYALLMFTTVPVLYVAMFMGIGVCCAMAGVVTGPAAINVWYDRNKALPMAIQVSAGSIGGFLMPVLVQFCAGISVNLCWIVFLAMNAATLLIAIFVVRNRPEDVGEIPDGYAWNKSHPLTKREQVLHDEDEPPLSKCYRSRQFWVLALQWFGNRAVNAGVNSYIIIYAIHSGVPQMQAALLITAYNVTGLIGRVSVGFIDRLHIKYHVMNVFCLALMAASCVLLFLGNSYGMFMTAILIIGYGFGALCALFPLLVSKYFGSGNFFLLNGTFNTLGTLGGFFAPLAIFAIAQALGGYGKSYMALGGLLLACLVFSIITPAKRIVWEKEKNG